MCEFHYCLPSFLPPSLPPSLPRTPGLVWVHLPCCLTVATTTQTVQRAMTLFSSRYPSVAEYAPVSYPTWSRYIFEFHVVTKLSSMTLSPFLLQSFPSSIPPSLPPSLLPSLPPSLSACDFASCPSNSQCVPDGDSYTCNCLSGYQLGDNKECTGTRSLNQYFIEDVGGGWGGGGGGVSRTIIHVG